MFIQQKIQKHFYGTPLFNIEHKVRCYVSPKPKEQSQTFTNK